MRLALDLPPTPEDLVAFSALLEVVIGKEPDGFKDGYRLLTTMNERHPGSAYLSFEVPATLILQAAEVIPNE